MLDRRAANDRAVRYAIRTGQMPNISLIQTIQGMEGHEPCFGRVESQCPRTHCRWHEPCMALMASSVVTRPGKGQIQKTPACFVEELGKPQAMTWRGTAEEACGCG